MNTCSVESNSSSIGVAYMSSFGGFIKRNTADISCNAASLLFTSADVNGRSAKSPAAANA